MRLPLVECLQSVLQGALPQRQLLYAMSKTCTSTAWHFQTRSGSSLEDSYQMLSARLLVLCSVAACFAAGERGVGLDTFDLFMQYVGQSPNNETFARESMQQACKDRNITILRVAGTGFWPDDVKSWLDDPDTWWTQFAKMVTDAETFGCRMIVNLFWNTFALPDIAGEPLRQALTNASSATRALHQRYIREAIQAAGSSKAIMAWELTNELNNLQDLDLGARQPSLAPSRGTPTQRSRLDNISTENVAAWGQAMVTLIDTLDPIGRPVSSGHSIARKEAIHLMLSYPTGKEDFTPDTQQQFEQALRIAHAPFPLMSMHMYAGGGDNIRFNSTPVDPYYTGLLSIVKGVASSMTPARQVLFGEFGDPLPGERPWTHSVLSALGAGPEQVDLALVWCFRFHQRAATIPANFSLELGRDTATLNAIAAANARIVAGG